MLTNPNRLSGVKPTIVGLTSNAISLTWREARSMTDRVLEKPLGTTAIAPSGRTATILGVLPTGIESTTWYVAVSITSTTSVGPSPTVETYASEPSTENATPVGPAARSIVAVTFRVVRSTTETLLDEL